VRARYNLAVTRDGNARADNRLSIRAANLHSAITQVLQTNVWCHLDMDFHLFGHQAGDAADLRGFFIIRAFFTSVVKIIAVHRAFRRFG
jgi:hypothetical protein